MPEKQVGKEAAGFKVEEESSKEKLAAPSSSSSSRTQ